MDAVFETALKAIEAQRLDYCVLRPESTTRSNARVVEVDLLLRHEHLGRFKRAVGELGFVALKSWGHRPHHFFVAFDRDNDRWLKLDVVVDLVYGTPIRFLRAHLGADCLASRRRRRGFYGLSPHHEAATLVLHCVLDKRNFRDEHRRHLRELAAVAASCGEVEGQFRECFASTTGDLLTWDEVAAAIRHDAWDKLLKRRRVIARKLYWSDPVGSIWRMLLNRCERRMRPVLYMLSRHGVAIALLAPDGAGKTTIAAKLSGERILRARSIYMGTNIDASTLGMPTTRWIKQRINMLQRPRSAQARALKVLSFMNRLCEQWMRCAARLYHIARGRLVVFDRYGYDGFLAAPDDRIGKRIRRALLTRSCVAPDLVFLLDAPGSVLHERKPEHSSERLDQQRRAYLAMREKIPNMTIIDATRPVREVYCEIVDRIWRQYANAARDD